MIPEMILVLLPEVIEVDLEMRLQGLREGDDAMFSSFGIVDLNGIVVEVEVLDPQAHRFADAQSGSIHELGRKKPGG